MCHLFGRINHLTATHSKYHIRLFNRTVTADLRDILIGRLAASQQKARKLKAYALNSFRHLFLRRLNAAAAANHDYRLPVARANLANLLICFNPDRIIRECHRISAFHFRCLLSR